MATGRTHARIAWLLFMPLAVTGGYFALFVHPWLGAGWLAGSLAGILITPDIDLETPTYEEWRFYRIAYPLGVLWQWLWFPYGAFMAHRGLSHVYLLGTLTRVGYLLCFVVPLAALLVNAVSPYLGMTYGYRVWIVQIDYAQVDSRFWWGLVGAWSVQDAGHIFTDHHHRQAARLRRWLHKSNNRVWAPAVMILLVLLFWLFR